MGPMIPRAGAVEPYPPYDNDNTTPLRGGMNIGVVRADFSSGGGTLGCILRDKHDGSAIYGLTNQHVVAPSKRRRSRSIRVYQPGVDPNGGRNPSASPPPATTRSSATPR